MGYEQNNPFDEDH